MTKTSEFRIGRHCVFQLHAHLIFVTKYRKKVFTKSILERMKNTFESVCKDYETTLKEMDGETDHVYLLIEYLPKVSLSTLVNSLKGVSSRMLRKEFPALHKHFWKGMLWSPSYFAANCGAHDIPVMNDEVLRRER